MKRKHTTKKSANRKFNKAQVLGMRNPFAKLFIQQMNEKEKDKKFKKVKKSTQRTTQK